MRLKKGQAELIGISIVVLLVVMGILFALKYSPGQKEGPTHKQVFDNQQMASNMLQAMLRTTTECNSLTFQQLFRDCAVDKRVYCGGDNSCAYLNETLPDILNDTIGVIGKNYELTATINNIKKLSITNGQCVTSGRVSVQPLPVPTGILQIKLLVCSKS